MGGGNPVARLVLAAIALVVLAQLAVPIARSLVPLLEGVGVLALAFAGLWLIASAPFRRRW